MNVALVGHEFPPYFIGGVGSYTYNLARFLSKRKVRVTVYCGRSAAPIRERISEYLDIVRLPFLDISLRAYWFQLENLRYLSKELAQHDIIHAISPKSAAICVALKSKLRKPVVTTIHDIPLMRTKAFLQAPVDEWCLGDMAACFLETPFDHLMIRYCLQESDKVVLVGSSDLKLATRIYSHLESKSVVIQNGIDLEDLGSLKRKARRNENKRTQTILFFGRLTWPKGISYLVKAMKILQDENQETELRIVGKGPMFSKLLRIAQGLDLTRRITFLGFLERKKLVDEILAADVISLPSLYEPMANLAMLEAMAFEKPIVVFGLPFVKGIIRHLENGVLVRPGDTNDLANKIRMLLTDSNLRNEIGKKARDYVREHHDFNSVVEKYIRVYEEPFAN